ncbi:cytochrome P450 [Aspergillus uvarum CBS 121591]|uniref:Cytochrome P450 n=1 Tax=Aspergillus uvarum CBS 121591 TaxID=1448315 RepID=A0A319D0U9_9EURO|nr:cytochrome P450 [Aspergillus uvarum CBS 121591]PYH84653.1 cytochrome P450 [Aspergillus uvarum CBS 121591]
MFFIAVFILAVCLAVISYTLTTVSNLPAPDFPSIPPWQTLSDIVAGMTRAESYDHGMRPIVEKHGAVNIWQGGRWVVVVTRPELVTQGGNIKKLPYSVFARLFGVNIIDSHGALHDSFTEIIKPGLQRKFDLHPVRASSQRLAQSLQQQQKHRPGSRVEIQHSTLNWAIDVVADSLMDLSPERMAEHRPAVHEAMHRFLTGISTKLQTLLYSVFPGLERWPWLMPSGDYGIRIVDTLEARIQNLAEIASQDPSLAASHQPSHYDNEKLIHRLRRALERGDISKDHFRGNLNQLFIAAVENIDIVLNSAMWELGKNPTLQNRLRQEVLAWLPANKQTGYSESDLDALPLLTATIYEALRLYPPLINLINRSTTQPVCLGSTSSRPLPTGTWAGWHAYGTHTDPSVWGASAREFDPDRWGCDPVSIRNMFRSMQVKGKYLPFTTHARRCLASKFAITVLKIALCELLVAVEWERDPEYKFELVKVGLRPRFGPEQWLLSII